MNLKIFVAPLQNRVHLITIVLVGMLFGVFRLSGGSVGLTSKHLERERIDRTSLKVEAPAPSRGREREPAPGEFDDVLSAGDETDMFNPQAQVRRLTGESGDTRPVPTAKSPTRSAANSSESLDELVDVRGVGEPAPKRPKNTGGLNDIEKLVGLR